MAVVVKVPTQLRVYTAGRDAIEVSGTSVAEALAALGDMHPGILDRILTDDGSVRRFVNIYVGDEDIRFLHGLGTAVRDDDSIAIIPAVAGGAVSAERWGPYLLHSSLKFRSGPR